MIFSLFTGTKDIPMFNAFALKVFVAFNRYKKGTENQFCPSKFLLNCLVQQSIL